MTDHADALLAAIHACRPCMDAETTQAELAEWAIKVAEIILEPHAARHQRAREVIGERGVNESSDYIPEFFSVATDDLARWLLIERSVHDGSLYLTTHDSPQDAAAYHESQECPDYWDVDALIDLDTGTSLRPVTTTTWEPA